MCYGRLDVVSDAGTVAATAAEVRRCLPSSILDSAPIYTSPLSRCVALAGALAETRRPVLAGELAEMNFGAWEGVPWDAVPRDELDDWARAVWDYRPGGGESVRMLAERWRQWRDRMSRSGHGAIIAVTHAGVIRTALQRAGRLRAGDWVRAPIEFGSVHDIEVADQASADPSDSEVRA